MIRKTAKLMLLVSACHAGILHPVQAQNVLSEIKTIVVIYAENRSFDHLYGLFPGANGLSNATAEQKTQLDHDGSVLPYLTVFAGDGKPDARFPRLPNEPFRIDAQPINISLNELGPSPVHAFYHNQDDLPPEKWTPGYADFASACSGVM